MSNLPKTEYRKYTSHIIDKFRDLISERYEYDILIERHGQSSIIDKQKVEELRYYFVNYVFPSSEKFEKLEDSFTQLSKYITKPNKVWHLLGNMAAAIFKFGKHFPKALKAGFVSLQTFHDAQRFEEILANEMIKLNLEIPLDKEQFRLCFREVPQRDLAKLIRSIDGLLKSISDTELLRKTLEILKDILAKMRKFPFIYSASEIEGIELGFEIIEKGYILFKNFSRDEKEEIRRYVIMNENWFMNLIYNSDEQM